jgi:hypothetical protein
MILGCYPLNEDFTKLYKLLFRGCSLHICAILILVKLYSVFPIHRIIAGGLTVFTYHMITCSVCFYFTAVR